MINNRINLATLWGIFLKIDTEPAKVIYMYMTTREYLKVPDYVFYISLLNDGLGIEMVEMVCTLWVLLLF